MVHISDEAIEKLQQQMRLEEAVKGMKFGKDGKVTFASQTQEQKEAASVAEEDAKLFTKDRAAWDKKHGGVKVSKDGTVAIDEHRDTVTMADGTVVQGGLGKNGNDTKITLPGQKEGIQFNTVVGPVSILKDVLPYTEHASGADPVLQAVNAVLQEKGKHTGRQ